MSKRLWTFRQIYLTPEDSSLEEYLGYEHWAVLTLAGENWQRLRRPDMPSLAKTLGVPIGTVRSRLSRAREVLVALRNLSRLEEVA